METLRGELTGPRSRGSGGQGGSSIPGAFQVPGPLRHTWSVCAARARPVCTLLYLLPTCFRPQTTPAAHSWELFQAGLETGSYPHYSGEETEAQRDDATKNADLRAGAPSEYT